MHRISFRSQSGTLPARYNGQPQPSFTDHVSQTSSQSLHGILLIVLFSFSAFYIADFEWVKHLSLSPLIVGIVLGMLYANSLRNHLPETWVPGIQFCTKQVLRTGIVLYGFKLTFQSVIDIGGSALTLDLIVVTLTILLGAGLGRLLKMDRDTALLTSIGSSICGAAAVLGRNPSSKANLTKPLWPFPPWSSSARSPCFCIQPCTGPEYWI